MSLPTKDLVSIKPLSAQQIMEILDLAGDMKKIMNSDVKKADHLIGKSVITLFYENSTRTRVSFEVAAQNLSGSVCNIMAASSSVQKGETLIDSGRNIDAMGVDVIVLRHPNSGAAALMAQHVKASVVNAGDGMNEHPTQALLDMLTIRDHFGDFKGLHVVIAGDVYHSRVARSDMWALQKLGARVSFAAPRTLLPPHMEQAGVGVYTDLDQAIKDADVVMGLRIQKERQQSGLFPSLKEYSKYFGVNEERMKLAKPHAILMHPGPINPGVELSLTLPETDQSRILTQVNNGVAVRMAVLSLLAKGGRK